MDGGVPSEFLSWWAQQMLDLLPARLRRIGALPPDALVVTLPGAPPSGEATQDAEVALRRRGGETPLGRFGLDDAGLLVLNAALRGRRRPPCVVLRPPASALLERRVTLPLAADRDPGGVLRYELDRLTPFAPDEVFWAWRQEGRDVPRGTLRLRVSLLPKAGLLAAIGALGRAGLAPTRLEPIGPDGQPRAMAVGDPDGTARPRREAWRRRGLAAAGILCGGLALAAVSLPFLSQSMALAAAERQIDALRSRVAEAERLRKQIAEAKGGRDAIAAERARVGEALQVVAALTEILPDDTHLTELTLRQRRLTMAGRSAAAARLIGLLSADPTIRDAAFVAPVTRSESAQLDVFSVRAEIGM
jgi:general secretion pathway protein L